jgi:hypothetical protein
MLGSMARQICGQAAQEHLRDARLEGRKALVLRSLEGVDCLKAALAPPGASGEMANALLREVLSSAGERGLGWDAFERALMEQGFLFLEVQDGPAWDLDWTPEAVEAAYEDLPSLPRRTDCDPGQAEGRTMMLLPVSEGQGNVIIVLSPPKAHPELAAKAIAESMAESDATGDWSWAIFQESLEAKGFVIPDVILSEAAWDSVVRPPEPVGLRTALAKGA